MSLFTNAHAALHLCLGTSIDQGCLRKQLIEDVSANNHPIELGKIVR